MFVVKVTVPAIAASPEPVIKTAPPFVAAVLLVKVGVPLKVTPSLVSIYKAPPLGAVLAAKSLLSEKVIAPPAAYKKPPAVVAVLFENLLVPANETVPPAV